MSKRPKDYREWHVHHRAILMYIGKLVSERVKQNQSTIDREIYYQSRRAKRVQMHVDAEWDAQTASAKEEFAKRMLHILTRREFK